jgi:hypothetical protein
MGFAMMENLFYEMSSISAASWSITALARGLGSTIIHAVGCGVVGYAYAQYIMKKGGMLEIGGAYMFAVLLHMIWNGTLTGLELNGSDAAFLSQLLFMIVWPMVEFLILKIFLDKAAHVDEQMFGPMGAKPYGKPPVPTGGGAPPALARGPYTYGAPYAPYGAGQPPPQQQRQPPQMPPQKVNEYEAGRYSSRPDAPAAPPTVPPRAQAAYTPPPRPLAAQAAPSVPTYSSPPPPPSVPYASSPPRAPTVMPEREEVISDDDD